MANESNNIFAPINYSWNEYKAPSSNSFGEAIKIRDDRHFKALEGKAAIAKQFRELGLVDDPEYVDAKSTEYMNRIDSNIREGGYAGDALTEIYNIGKEMQSDPVLWGKVANQKECDAYKDAVNKSTDITQDGKDYFNAYSHYTGTIKKQGETDEQAIRNRELERQYAEYEKRVADAAEYSKIHGIDIIIPPMERPASLDAKEIGVVKWRPQVTPQKWYDFTKEWAVAVSTLAHEFGGTGTKIYVKRNNKYVEFDGDLNNTDDKMFYYSKTTGGYEKLSEERIKQELYALMGVDGKPARNQELRNSFDYYIDVEQWKDNGGNSIYTTAQGLKQLDKNKILKDAIDNFAKGRAFTKYNPDSYKAYDGMTAVGAAAKAAAKNGGISSRNIPPSLKTGLKYGEILQSATTLAGMKQNMNKRKEALTELCNKYSNPVDGVSLEQRIQLLLNSPDIDADNKIDIQRQYDEYVIDKKRYDHALESLHNKENKKEIDEAEEFLNGIDSYGDFNGADNENGYLKKYRQKVKDIYGDHEYIAVKLQENGIDAFKSKYISNGVFSPPPGIEIIEQDGDTYVALNRYNGLGLYSFSNVIKELSHEGAFFGPKGVKKTELEYYPDNVKKYSDQNPLHSYDYYVYLDPGNGISSMQVRGKGSNLTNNYLADIEDEVNSARKIVSNTFTDPNQKMQLTEINFVPYENIYEMIGRDAGWDENKVQDITERGKQMFFNMKIDEHKVYSGSGKTLLPTNKENAQVMLNFLNTMNTAIKNSVEFFIEPELGGTIVHFKGIAEEKDKYNKVLAEFGDSDLPIIEDLKNVTGDKVYTNGLLNNGFNMFVSMWYPDPQVLAIYNSGEMKGKQKLKQDAVNGGRTFLYDGGNFSAVGNGDFVYSPDASGESSIPIAKGNSIIFKKDQAAAYISMDENWHNIMIVAKYKGCSEQQYHEYNIALTQEMCRIFGAESYNDLPIPIRQDINNRLRNLSNLMIE